MKKIFALAMFAAILSLGATLASADDIRDLGIGIRADQENGVDNVFDFPNQIVNFNLYEHRMGFFENKLGSNGNWGGIIRKDCKIGNWALYLDRPVLAPNQAWANIYAQGNYLGVFENVVGWSTLLTGTDGALTIPTLSTHAGLSVGNIPGLTLTSTVLTPERNFDFIKAFNVGEGVLGVRVEYGRNKATGAEVTLADTGTEGTTPEDFSRVDTNDQCSSMMGLQVGYGKDGVGPFNHLDVGLGYTMGSVNNETNLARLAGAGAAFGQCIAKLEGDGISSIRLKLRGIKDAGENNTLHVVGTVRMDKLAIKDDLKCDNNNDGDFADGEHAMANVEYKDTFFSLGANLNRKVHDGMGMVVVGLTGYMDKSSREQVAMHDTVAILNVLDSQASAERNYMAIYANIGVESSLTSWLTFRSGIAKELIASCKSKVEISSDIASSSLAFEDKTTGENTVEPAERLMITNGVSATVKNWTLDLQMRNIFEQISNGVIGAQLRYQL